MIGILLFLTVAAFSCQSLFCRLYTSSRNGSGAVQFSVFYAVVTGILTLAVSGFSYHPSVSTVVLGLINAAVIFAYNMSLVKCSSLGSYAFMMICNLSGGILVPMVYDMVYLRSTFTKLQWLGVLLMLCSFVFMNLDGIKSKKNRRFLLWCLALFFANGAYGVFMNLQQELNGFTQRHEMIVTTFLGMAVFTAAAQLIFSGKSFISGFHMSRKSFFFMLLSALSATFAVNMMMYVMASLNMTVMYVVNNGGVLALSAIFAFLIFKEKPAVHTILGLLMAAGSILLLSA